MKILNVRQVMNLSYTTLFAILIFCASPLRAQSIWTMRGDNSTIEVEYLHPVLKDGSNATSAEIVTVSTRIKTGSTSTVILELPWVSGETTSGFLFPSNSESAIANPYLGIEFQSHDTYFFGEVGVRLPLMSEHATTAAVAGITGDFDRFEAYTPQIFQVGGALNLKPNLGGGFNLRLRCGPVFDFSTRNAGGSETLINYAAILGFASESVEAGAGLVGRASTTQNSSNSTVDQIEGIVRLHIDHVHPAIQLRTPIDVELQNAYDLEFGINLAYEF